MKGIELPDTDDGLYIFVANEEEKHLYEQSLKGLPYKKIIVGEKGGANATRAICRYFPVGQRILFVDDDLSRFFTFSEDGTQSRGILNVPEKLDFLMGGNHIDYKKMCYLLLRCV